MPLGQRVPVRMVGEILELEYYLREVAKHHRSSKETSLCFLWQWGRGSSEIQTVTVAAAVVAVGFVAVAAGVVAVVAVAPAGFEEDCMLAWGQEVSLKRKL